MFYDFVYRMTDITINLKLKVQHQFMNTLNQAYIILTVLRCYQGFKKC